ncbi:hypothetical protein [Fulvitalea axinellae]|uniref:hypothetical protein n=1 Tax=Fulvitalea axinellae TaxID=1182444 RepID=UPI0030CA4B98
MSALLFVALLLCFFSLETKADDGAVGGLRLKGAGRGISEYSGLDLTFDVPVFFQNTLQLSADLSFMPDSDMGYVLRLLSSDGQSLDAVYYPGYSSDSLAYLRLVLNRKSTELSVPVNKNTSAWTTLELSLDGNSGELNLSVSGGESVRMKTSFRGGGGVFMVFGSSVREPRLMGESSRMAVRNVSVFRDGEPSYYWPLSEMEGDLALDTVAGKRAKTMNADWLAPTHSVWRVGERFRLPAQASVAFDDESGRVFVSEKGNIRMLELESGTFKSLISKNDLNIVAERRLFFSDETGSVKVFDRRMGGVSELKDRQWSRPTRAKSRPDFTGQNLMVDNVTGQLYLMNGYSEYQYRNSLYSFGHSWNKENFEGDVVTPRHQALSGRLTDRSYLLFSGIGNQQGPKELGSTRYFDLYKVDLAQKGVRKLWDLTNSPDRPEFLPVGNLYADKEGRRFYCLGTSENGNGSLELYEVGIDSSYVRTVSGALPCPVRSVERTGLYYNIENKSLSAFLVYQDGQDRVLESYTLAWPPGYPPEIAYNKDLSFQDILALAIIALLGLSVTVVSVIWIFKLMYDHRRLRKAKNKVSVPLPVVDLRNSVKVLGEMSLLNRDGEDISGKLTPKIRELFLLLLCESEGGGKGLAPQKITDALWPDSDQAKAKGTRSMALRRLRTALEEVDGVDVEIVQNRWRLSIQPESYCDYRELLAKLKRCEQGTKGMTELLDLVYGTDILEQFGYAWAESQRSFLIGKISNVLSVYANRLIVEAPNSIPEVLKISDIILGLDSLDDRALRFKISALRCFGNHSAARSVYRRFVREYMELYGEKYPLEFSEILGVENELPEA